MRADRLLSLLLLLQSRGRMTARQLAQALEVSERTIYRDVDALTAAGVPIYAEYRRGGGYALLDNYRTTLTGLTQDEIRALFMLSIPAPLDALGMSATLRRALLKLSAVLPASQRQDEKRVQQRIFLDSTGWLQASEAIPTIQLVQRAVWDDRQIVLKYGLPLAGSVEIEQIVNPYGMVAKAGIWYLVYGYQQTIRVRRIADLLDVQLLPAVFERPPGFDLQSFWMGWCASSETNRLHYPVVMRVAPSFLPELPRHLDDRLHLAGLQSTADADGWRRLTVTFESFENARQRVLGCGRGVEVLEPEALRLSVLDFATQIVAHYSLC